MSQNNKVNIKPSKVSPKKDNSNKYLHKNTIINALDSEEEGLTISQLKKKTGLERAAIPRLVGEINKENDIGIIKINKKGTYSLANKVVKKEIATQYSVFGQDAVRELLGGISNGLTSSVFLNGSNPTTQITDLLQIEESFLKAVYTNRKFNEESEMLFHFAMKMGSLITFIMLRAIAPFSHNKDGKTKEIESKLWVETSITPYQMLFHFMQYEIVKSGKLRKKSQVDSMIKGLDPRLLESDKVKTILNNSIPDSLFSPWEINHETYQELEKGFKTIWPYTYKILSNLSEVKRLQVKTESGIKSTTKLKLKSKKHNK
jgi:hypothetical protein